MAIMKKVAWLLLIIGGLNWGLVGLFDFNLVSTIFGDGSMITKVIYDLVGLSAIVGLFCCKKCKCCQPTGSTPA